MIIQPFQIQVPDTSILDLHERLARARWPDEIAGMGWGQGTDLGYLRELVRYWLQEFDWRSHESRLNKLNQYVADIEGARIHYLHIRGKGPAPTPLIMTHGWPGSFLEMEKVIPLLTDPAQFGGSAEDAFDVIVPSVPGFGFSERPAAVGMNAQKVAGIWNSLMHSLGYDRYGAQGGDVGAGISTWLGYDYPESVIGIHLNYIPGAYERNPGSQPLTAAEQQFLAARESWLQEEGGYWHVQATKPQTLAFGLNDSPIGLAAWILEKYRSWSDCNGNVENRFTKDEMLTNISLYWFTQTIGSSCRYYYDGRTTARSYKDLDRMTVPAGVSVFPKEEPMPPREYAARFYNVQRWTLHSKGGHFAAMEEPQALVKDVRAFFRQIREGGPEMGKVPVCDGAIS